MLILKIHRSKAGIHIVRRWRGEEIYRTEEEEVSEFKAGYKVKEREEEREVDESGEKEEQEGITDWAGISLPLSSFYPGTKLLFRRRLFEFGKRAE